jgi:anti-sigma regulatory factor (Ser/Thr protein kinase)
MAETDHVRARGPADRRPDSRLTLRDVPAEAANVPLLRHAVVRFACAHGATSVALGDLRLAVTEAVGNAVMHAYETGEQGVVHVNAGVADGILEVTVADEGHGIRAKSSSGQGLGLALVASTTAEFSIAARRPRGTEVRMRFVLALAAA